MHTTQSLSWLALAAVGFAVSAARADMITPDSISISKQPAAVGSANGTYVFSSNLVTNQYVGMGLNFGKYSSTAITSLNNIAVWAPVMTYASIGASGAVGPNSPVGEINYYRPWAGASLTSPVTGQPITASSLTLETLGRLNWFGFSVYGRNGQPLNITPTIQSLGTASPIGSTIQIWKFKGDGISSFGTVIPEGVIGAGWANTTWGVAAVSFTPDEGQTPEPSSLLLAGLGVLGLAARFGWRRRRGQIV